MADFDALQYRKGRLVLPTGIVDWPPVQVGRWLARVPVAERARAFRALPLNVAAAGFLTMDPQARVGLICGLNAANVRYLVAIARDAHLIETLSAAGPDVEAAVLAALPDWRRTVIAAQLLEARSAAAEDEARSGHPPAPGLIDTGKGALLRGWRRLGGGWRRLPAAGLTVWRRLRRLQGRRSRK